MTFDSAEDRAKFEQIYLTYHGLMFHIANGILHNEQDAEDAVHNAFLSVAKNLSKLDQPRSPRTRSYVSLVCESRAIDLYRKRQKDRGEPVPDPDMYRTAAAGSVEGRSLEWCILQLPPPDREIILLKYRHGYNVQEVAGILEISLEAARKRDQRARARLNELCRREGLL